MSLAFFPYGFSYANTAGEIVVDHVLPLIRGSDELPLVAVGSNDLLVIEGWATTNGVNRRTVDAVYLNLDQVPTITAAYGEERSDVASVHGQKTLRCGYRGIVPLGRVAPGFHTISASVLDFAQSTYGNSAETRFLVVDPRIRTTPSDLLRVESATNADSNATEVIYGARVRIQCTVNQQLQAPPASVILLVNGDSVVECTHGQTRPKLSDESGIGYEAVLGSELIGGGSHTIRAVALAADGTAICESVNAVELNIAEAIH